MVVLTTGMLLVFGLIAVALILFVTEVVTSDITAIGVLVSLALLEPWTGVPPSDALSGFASSATITILAMYILSDGIQRTGIVDRLGVYLGRITQGDEQRLLGTTIGTTGIAAGIINNTPVVAVFIPMISGLADRAGISPSKLLLPLSYAAMLGGTLTLIGTSTNLLASDLSRELLDHPIGMFEFTPLGILVLAVGSLYLLTIGRRLTPDRIPAALPMTDEFELEDHLSRVVVKEGSPIVGLSLDAAVDAVERESELDVDLLRLERDGDSVFAAESDLEVEVGDVLLLRSSLQVLNRLSESFEFRQLPREEVEDEDLIQERGTLIEAIVLPESGLVGETVAEAMLEDALDTTVLAIRRSERIIRTDLDETLVKPGDTFLLQTTEAAIEFLTDRGDLVVSHDPEAELPDPDISDEELAPISSKTPVALGIMAVVIGVAALGIAPIVIAALGGVVAMVVTGCITSSDAYDAVSWNIIFLLAGVLPLGVAMQRTGGDAVIASLLVGSADLLPIIAVLGLFYVLTGLLANIITPVASVVLMIPIAVDTASRLDANGFAFLLAVTFAGSSAFMTPIGYQTNLMVYGPGGYKFTDYLRVGGPLQMLLAVVVTLGISVLFGLSA